MKLIRSMFTILILIGLLSACAPAEPTAEIPTEQPAVEVPVAVEEPTQEPTAAPTDVPWEPVTVNMTIQPYLGIAPLFIGIEEGFFEDEGLIIVPIEFRSGKENAAAIASGMVDVASADINITYFNIMAQDPSIKMVVEKGFANVDGPCSYQAILTGLDMPEYVEGMDLAFLKGQTINFIEGNQHQYMFDKFFASSGFSTADLTNLPVDAAVRAEAMSTGQLVISSTGEPFISRYVSSGGVKIWLGFEDILPNNTISTIVFGKLFTETNPEAGVRWMRAYLRAVEQYNRGMTDRNVEIMAKYTKLDPELIRQACPSDLRPNGQINLDGIMEYQQWAVDHGYMDALLPVENFWNDSFLRAATE